jgi:hypothetical protein
MFTHRTRLETHPGASPVSSNSVLGRERKTMRSRFVASPDALHRDFASHRDPPRIAALVASRIASTQGTALRCDRRDSGVASRHSLSVADPFFPSRGATHRGVASLRARGGRRAAARRLLGPQISLPNGLEFCCRTGQVVSPGRPATQPRSTPARRGASRCSPTVYGWRRTRAHSRSAAIPC